MTEVPGIFYDGQRSHAHTVAVRCQDGMLHVHGEGIERRDPVERIAPSAPLAGVPFTLRYADGAHLQLPADAPVGQWFPRRNALLARVDRWERRAGIAAVCVLIVGLALAGLFAWGVPTAADYAVRHLPAAVDRAMGAQSLAVLRAHWLSPSTLPATRRAQLQTRFRGFVRRSGDRDALRLEFYQSRAFGANAFSLGGGIIVVTDAMVRALPDDDAFLAVVAHEMGHERYRHTLRMVLRGSGVAVVASLLLGDVSGGAIASAIPVFLLNAHYSRGFERQADRFAFVSLAHADISPMAFVRAMRALEKVRPELRHDADARYLSSHPVTQARIAAALAAAHRFDATTVRAGRTAIPPPRSSSRSAPNR